MEDEQIITSENTSRKEINNGGNGINKFLAGLVILLLLVIVGGGAYFFGTKEGKNNLSGPTPTQSLSQNELLGNSIEAFPTATPIPTTIPTINPSIKPIKTPTATPTPKILTKTLTSTISLDGFESSNGVGNTGVDVRAGRNINLTTRGFVSFATSDIPSNATITEATLRLYQTKTIGNPYTVGGKLMVDSLNYGTTLENSDYSIAAITSNLVSLTSTPTVEWKDANITDAVKKDLAEGREKSQFRLHFETEAKGGDVSGDFAYFESADNSEGSGNIPQLVIKYY